MIMDNDSDPEIGNIREDWDLVGPALQEICDQFSYDWIPEDVYASVSAGAATYFKTPAGFVIARVYREEYSNDRCFLIWIAYAYQKDLRLVFKYLPFFDKLAKEEGCTKLVTATQADNLGKHLQNAGFGVQTTFYERSL